MTDILAHLRETFDRACRQFPDLMESHIVRFADCEDPKEFVRAALAETFKRRFPIGSPTSSHP